MGDFQRHRRGGKRAAQGRSLRWIVKRVFARSQEDDALGLAAELAFQFFLAPFPFFIFLGAVGTLIARLLGIVNPAGQIVALLGSNLPPSASETVRSVVSEPSAKETTTCSPSRSSAPYGRLPSAPTPSSRR